MHSKANRDRNGCPEIRFKFLLNSIHYHLFEKEEDFFIFLKKKRLASDYAACLSIHFNGELSLRLQQGTPGVWLVFNAVSRQLHENSTFCSKIQNTSSVLRPASRRFCPVSLSRLVFARAAASWQSFHSCASVFRNIT